MKANLMVNKPYSVMKKFSGHFWLLFLCSAVELLLASPGYAKDFQVTPTGAMAEPRMNHTATLLPTGEVLVVGGTYIDAVSSRRLATAELYDPATGNWDRTSNLPVPRTFH